MGEWNAFGYSFDYSFAYGNRKGPHKQSLIENVLHFQNFKKI